MEHWDEVGASENKPDSCPLQEIEECVKHDEIISRVDNSNKSKCFLSRARHGSHTGLEILEGVCLPLAYAILGWTKGQLGPAFLDLLHISRTDIDKGSGFMTSYYTGRLVGSGIGGTLYTKMNRHLVIVASLITHGSVVAAIPWCNMFELMVAAHIVHRFSGGVLDVGITSGAISISGRTTKGRSYLQILNIVFAVSGLLAPMATAPFLLPRSGERNITNTVFDNQCNLTCNNASNLPPEPSYPGKHFSQLYIAYSISSAMAIISTVPFLVLYFLSKKVTSQSLKKKSKVVFLGDFPLIWKHLQFINIGIFAAVLTAVDFTFSGYLTVFCVNHLLWTKTNGAMLTSVLFFATLVGRFGSIFLVHFFQPHTLLLLCSIANAIGFVGMALSAHAYFDIGIWISVCAIGIPFGISWPTFLSWTNENLIHVCGKVTAYLLVTSFVGALLSPLLVGYLMEKINPIWFCYLCIANAVVTVINALLMVLYTKYTRK